MLLDIMTSTFVTRKLAPQMVGSLVLSRYLWKCCPVFGVIFQNFAPVIGTYFQNFTLVVGPNAKFSKAHVYQTAYRSCLPPPFGGVRAKKTKSEWIFLWPIYRRKYVPLPVTFNSGLFSSSIFAFYFFCHFQFIWKPQ